MVLRVFRDFRVLNIFSSPAEFIAGFHWKNELEKATLLKLHPARSLPDRSIATDQANWIATENAL